MKILETLVISREQSWVDELAAGLPTEEESLPGLKVRRLPVAPHLDILLHITSPDQEIGLEMMTHLQPHISALLVLSGESIGEFSPLERTFIEDMAARCYNAAVVVAVRTTADKLKEYGSVLNKTGLFLQERGRILFWCPQVGISRKNVWDYLWNVLQLDSSFHS